MDGIVSDTIGCLIGTFPFFVAAARVYNGDVRIAGLIAIPATAVTFIVNQVSDPGSQVALLVVFGFVFGLPWALREIKGVFTGVVVGLLLGILVIVVDATTGSMTGPEMALGTLVKWLVPICSLTGMASAPLLADDR